ncbi:phosphatase PAP2 family protein [Dokdonella sp.]|uniref:phosphatase PAP2 family protein n=1 Tax=Dokdonella sp. TaxID=2291710 RepID=UPI002633E7D3|nr:phosphatase PAP2 family protein [Dokdonella sp.]
MNRRVLVVVAIVAIVLLAAGFAGLDRPLAEWVHSSGVAHAPVFVHGLGALDTVSGLHVWYWLAGCVALGIGLVAGLARRTLRWPRVLVAAALVQFATIASMIAGKTCFGRLRPQQVLESGDWSHAWFAGGGSFPSGHSAFYFGLLLPLAAACPIRWLRAVLLAIPVFAVLARIDLEKHFLSDVSMSAALAALYSLLVATMARRWLAPRGPQASPIAASARSALP